MGKRYTSLLPVVAAASAALAGAQSTTVVNVFFPDLDDQSLLASVMTVASSSTQYYVECPATADSEDCGLPAGLTLWEGPSTMAYTATVEGGVYTADCKLASDNAVCSYTIVGESVDPTDAVQTLTADDLDYVSIPITITAGLDKLSGAAATSTTDGASSTGAPSPGSSSGQSGATATATAAKATGTGSNKATETGGVARLAVAPLAMGLAAVAGGVWFL